jgi:hypothetical protein
MLPQLVTSLNVSSIKDLRELLNLYSLLLLYRAYSLYIRTPESFKEQIPKSCIYNGDVSKEHANKELESVVTVSTNEILSILFKDYCLICIQLTSEIQNKRYELASSSSLTFNDIKQDHFKYKSFANTISKNTLKCNACSRSINDSIIVVLTDNPSLISDWRIKNEYILSVKDADKNIQAILQKQTNERSLVIITDKRPESIEGIV